MTPCMGCAQTALANHVCYRDSQYVQQTVDTTDIWEPTGIKMFRLVIFFTSATENARIPTKI